jgi:hypothetical protein
MPVKCFGKICNGVMMSGVATIPSYRSRGIMHSLMDFFKNTMAESGAEVIVYKAANPEIYYSYDQYPCTMKADFLYHNTYFPDKEITNKFNLKNALDIYNSFSENYQGIIVRDSELMKLRSEDYFTDKCEFTMLENRAYCFGELVDETYILHEVCYKKPEDFFELLRGINVCKIKGILPADFPMADKFKNFTVGSHGTIVPISPDLIPAEPKELTIGKRTEKLLLRPSTFILDEY